MSELLEAVDEGNKDKLNRILNKNRKRAESKKEVE
jgi:hypothetical protein